MKFTFIFLRMRATSRKRKSCLAKAAAHHCCAKLFFLRNVLGRASLSKRSRMAWREKKRRASYFYSLKSGEERLSCGRKLMAARK